MAKRMTTKEATVDAASTPRLPPIIMKEFVPSEQLGAGSYGKVYKGRKNTGEREWASIL